MVMVYSTLKSLETRVSQRFPPVVRQYARLSSSQILLNVDFFSQLLRNFSWAYFVRKSCLQKKRYYALLETSIERVNMGVI